jgi:hypothetical protein
MNAVPAGYVEVRKGVYERIDTVQRAFLDLKSGSRNSKPKRPVRNEPLAKNEGKEKNTGRIHIRFTVYRKRLIDPDNIIAKYLIDSLRYAGAIPDDRAKDITLEIKQEKTREEEETLIELFYESAGV